MSRSFRAEGITVIMGGFHTSGTINMLSAEEPDIQELFREGICVVSGEVEGKWDGILTDFLQGQLKPLYSFAQDLQNLVDIEMAPLPQTSAKTMNTSPIRASPPPILRAAVLSRAASAPLLTSKDARCASAARRASPR